MAGAVFFNILVIRAGSTTRIYSVDKLGFCDMQKKCQKVIAVMGTNQVDLIASGYKGVNTRIVLVAFVNALGTSVRLVHLNR
jgi:hypothetical protein